MKFSVIVVCLNPGEKLAYTMNSILAQKCRDFEVILKDGGSNDGSLEPWIARAAQEPRIRVIQQKDRGIYDAMNQAVAQAAGCFVIFMNCGDAFYDSEALSRAERAIRAREAEGDPGERLVLYGDTYNEKFGARVAAPPKITGFTCYRHLPCHQSCFYSIGLCREKPFDLQYRIRADYDHFLWCFYRAGASFQRLNGTVASFEGGGYSESRENKKRNQAEHRRITARYMGKGELFRYRAILFCTLAPLRSRLAESGAFSGMYQKLKALLYGAGKTG